MTSQITSLTIEAQIKENIEAQIKLIEAQIKENIKGPRHWALLGEFKLIEAQVKENIKGPRHWAWLGEFTGDWWIPRTKGQ